MSVCVWEVRGTRAQGQTVSPKHFFLQKYVEATSYCSDVHTPPPLPVPVAPSRHFLQSLGRLHCSHMRQLSHRELLGRACIYGLY